MSLDSTELSTLRDELVRARAMGLRIVEYGDKRIEYRSDAEMASAISDLEARIARALKPRRSAVMFSSSKGL